MALNDIVNVVITRQTQSISQAGFGIPLILGANNRFTDRIRFYTSLAEVALDFDPSDPEYIASQDVFAQDVSVERLAIGRRQVDNVDIDIETAMSGQDYSIFINGNEYTVTGTSPYTYSVVTLNNDLVPNNRISVQLNGTEVGTVTSVIDFSSDFVASNSILPRVNGVNLSPAVTFTTDQATTIALVATKIEAATGVASATVTGPRQITVVFSAPGDNTVDSVITTGGASQPVANIGEGGFVYTTSSAQTMQNIATALDNSAGVESATVSGLNNRTITVVGPNGTTATVDSFVVSKGTSQAIASITNPQQNSSAATIGSLFVTEINSDVDRVVNANYANGLLTLSSRNPGTPYTARVSTSIVNPNQARVKITQVLPNALYDVTINNITTSYVTPNNVQSATQIVTALVDLINDQGFSVSATNNNDGTFELSSDNSQQNFSLRVSPEIMTIQQGLIINPLQPSQGVALDLDAVRASDNNWYGLVLTDRTVGTVLAAAGWTESNEKLFGTASNDLSIINVAPGDDLTSIAYQLGALGYNRTFVMYHQDAEFDYPEAAWFGAVLPLIPGSETWKFKQLRGVSYSNLTTNQSNNALGKKANTYEFVAGVGITGNGTVISGEYIDVIRGIDWLKARIQEFVFAVLVNNPKVPYTDKGIATIQAEVLRALSLGIDNGLLTDDPEPVVTVPRARDVPLNDKNARILRNVVFSATLAGAVHFVSIRGNISV